MNDVKFLLTGDSSLSVEFGREISKELNNKVHALNILLKESDIDGILETVPTYRSLMIYYDARKLTYEEVTSKFADMLEKLDTVELPKPSVIELPVLYGGEGGPDLEYVAKYNKITAEDVVRIHTSTPYLIYCLGFTPGFPIMGGLSPEIATPRLASPRVLLPANTVGIGGNQTGAYPIDSPGGWQLIGHMPIKLYDPGRRNPVLLSAGMYAQFISINRDEYIRIKEQVEQGTYECKVYEMEG